MPMPDDFNPNMPEPPEEYDEPPCPICGGTLSVPVVNQKVFPPHGSLVPCPECCSADANEPQIRSSCDGTYKHRAGHEKALGRPL